MKQTLFLLLILTLLSAHQHLFAQNPGVIRGVKLQTKSITVLVN